MNASIPNKDSYDAALMFSRITTANWLAPDRESSLPNWSSEQWIASFLKPQLDNDVPAEVRRLFEIARGCMIYSWFFYPLATLGFEQITRVMESAVCQRCEMLKLRTGRYEENINALVRTGVISVADQPRWHAGRRLRNSRSHPEDIMLIDPGQAWGQLENCTELINSLFAER